MNPIFYASKDTLPLIYSHIQNKTPFFPVSTRELSLPNVSLPSTGILIATSGSSGKPKYAHLSFENFFYNAEFSHPDLLLTPEDCWSLSLPLYHVSGLSIVFRSLVFGARMCNTNITHISFVPTQLKRFLKNPINYPKLKAILIGGAPIPYELCKEAYDKGFPIYLTYGMTEMASQIATKQFHPSEGISFGYPLTHRELKICNGEIYVRGKTLFHGYLNHPSPFIDGWFPTKDIGRIGPHGIEILGRKDRMIISGGEKIHPEEIERALLSHPEVYSVKVTPRPDPEFGEKPTALVATTVSSAELLEYLSSSLPRHKLPEINIIQSDKALTTKG